METIESPWIWYVLGLMVGATFELGEFVNNMGTVWVPDVPENIPVESVNNYGFDIYYLSIPIGFGLMIYALLVGIFFVLNRFRRRQPGNEVPRGSRIRWALAIVGALVGLALVVGNIRDWYLGDHVHPVLISVNRAVLGLHIANLVIGLALLVPIAALTIAAGRRKRHTSQIALES